MKPQVSIVITCYNYGSFLTDAIESCLQQIVKPIEIIVVDDGSTDNTKNIAKSYTPKKVKYIHQKNAGPSVARNKGVKAASGDWIICLDADDELDKTYISSCLRYIHEHPEVDFVYTDMNLFGQKSGIFHARHFNIANLLTGNYIHSAAMVRRKDILLYPYNEQMRDGLEDWDFFLTLAEHGLEGGHISEALLRYRQHEATTNVNAKAHGKANLKQNIQRIYANHQALYKKMKYRVLYYRCKNATERAYYQARERIAQIVKK